MAILIFVNCSILWTIALFNNFSEENSNSTNSTGENKENNSNSTNSTGENKEDNSNSTNSTGENKEDNSTSHSWEEMKKDPLNNNTLPSAQNITAENIQDIVEIVNGTETADQGEKEDPEVEEDPEEEDSNANKCEDSNDLCKTPELLGTFLKIALKEDQGKELKLIMHNNDFIVNPYTNAGKIIDSYEECIKCITANFNF